MNLDVNKKSKTYCRMEAIVNVPIKDVYQKVADIAKWPSWRTDVKEVSLRGEVAEGSEFVWKAGGLKFVSKIHTLSTDKEIGWTGKTLWISAVHNWHFSKKGKSTLVRIEENLSGLGSGFMKKSIETAMKKDLADLKKAIEK